MERKPIENLKAVKKYDPTKNYTWEQNDVFTVSGAEIDIWNKAFSVYVNTPEFQRFLILQKAAIAMQTFIEESVEQGLMKEKIEGEKPLIKVPPLKVEENGSAVEGNG